MCPYNNNSSRSKRATATTTRRKRQLWRRRSSWRNKPCLSGSSWQFHTVHNHTSFPLFPKIVNMTNTSLVQHNLKRFSHIFTVQVASHIRSISMDGEGLPLAKRMNVWMSFSRNWFGPYTLLPRLVMTGDALPSPGVNPLEGSLKCSCGKRDSEGRSWLPTLERGRRSSWEPRD